MTGPRTPHTCALQVQMTCCCPLHKVQGPSIRVQVVLSGYLSLDLTRTTGLDSVLSREVCTAQCWTSTLLLLLGKKVKKTKLLHLAAAFTFTQLSVCFTLIKADTNPQQSENSSEISNWIKQCFAKIHVKQCCCLHFYVSGKFPGNSAFSKLPNKVLCCEDVVSTQLVVAFPCWNRFWKSCLSSLWKYSFCQSFFGR